MNNLSSPEDENSCCESDSQLVRKGKRRGRLQRDPSGSTSSSGVENVPGVPLVSVDGGHIERPVGSTPMASYNEERMRRKLQFFFMNPIEKWQARRRFPYKFFVQVVKILLVTIQLCLFAHSRYNHINYTWDNRVTFSHLFLNGWDESREVESYPPSVGPLALYVQSDFFQTIDYAIEGYQNLSQAIGPYSYPNEDNTMAPMHLCLYRYKEGTIFGFNESYIFNSEIDTLCLNLTGNVTDIGSEAYLASKDVVVSFSALVKATLEMSVKTVNFKAAGPIAPPDCYQFNIQILFDNRDHDGQMLLSLDAEPIRLNCKGNIEYTTESNIDDTLRSILNMLVIVICITSFALCTRAVYRAQLLRVATVQFFRTHFGTELSWEGRMEFLNMWYIMIICNDVLLIIGSALKEQIQRRHFVADEWNTCSVLLGIGNLLVWFGVLRYLGFFKTYNVVILTLKRAAPKISRFLLCALLIYAGFTFCGWLILGPYHLKFRSLAITSECLFSLINGDDMFATFTTMSGKSNMLWWFSRIYLYSFISLYIYVVLSLFISVIMDAYDTIKKYYKEGFPVSDLKMFVGTVNPEEYIAAGVTEEDSEESFLDVVYRFFKWRRRNAASDGPTGYTSLHPKP
ncbi:mucolipin-3-like [Phlebotomus argentipes]|uniref:mucolipin-3-like n=1 Tax=Phlebotomus argentipes TaxID=94469 RepID=UPI002892C397|nr:mucolipin-3-like [Phlebotomus argentipes]